MGLISRVSSRTYRNRYILNSFNLNHKMASGNAKIGAQAPEFSTTAVVNGDFVENFSMSQFRENTWCSSSTHLISLLFAQPKFAPFRIELKNSKSLAVRFLLAQPTRTSAI